MGSQLVEVTGKIDNLLGDIGVIEDICAPAQLKRKGFQAFEHGPKNGHKFGTGTLGSI